MSSTEAIVNAIVVSVVLGALLGGLAVHVLVVEPLFKQAAREHQRRLRAEADLRQARVHRGTPYLQPVPLPSELEGVLVDNDDWSKSAELRARVIPISGARA